MMRTRTRARGAPPDPDGLAHPLTFFLSARERRAVIASLDRHRAKAGIGRTAGWRSRALTIALEAERFTQKEPNA